MPTVSEEQGFPVNDVVFFRRSLRARRHAAGRGEAGRDACLLSRRTIGNIRSNESYDREFQAGSDRYHRQPARRRRARRAKHVEALARLGLDPAAPVRDLLEECRLLPISMAGANRIMLNLHFASSL